MSFIEGLKMDFKHVFFFYFLKKMHVDMFSLFLQWSGSVSMDEESECGAEPDPCWHICLLSRWRVQ